MRNCALAGSEITAELKMLLQSISSEDSAGISISLFSALSLCFASKALKTLQKHQTACLRAMGHK
jgi:hypothetical protein